MSRATIDRPKLTRTNYEHLDEETEELLGQVVRQVEIQLYKRNIEAAHEIVDQAEEIWAEAGKKRWAQLDDPLTALLSERDVRTINMLEGAGLFTVEQLLRCSKGKLFEICNFGESSWSRINEALRRNGYEHGGNEEAIAKLAQAGFRRQVTLSQPESPDHARSPGMPQLNQPQFAESRDGRAVDPIDAMLQTLSTADESTLASIDARIAAQQEQLDKLRRLRQSVAKIIGGSKPEKSSRRSFAVDLTLENKVVSLVTKQGPLLPGEIAKALGVAPINIGRLVSASSRLEKDGAAVVVVTP